MSQETPEPGDIWFWWVPFEEDPSQGKDRPVLVLRSVPAAGVALKITSTPHPEGPPYWALLLDEKTEGLTGTSYAECGRLLILEGCRKRRYAGRAAPEDLRRIRETHPVSLAGTEYAPYVAAVLENLP